MEIYHIIKVIHDYYTLLLIILLLFMFTACQNNSLQYIKLGDAENKKSQFAHKAIHSEVYQSSTSPFDSDHRIVIKYLTIKDDLSVKTIHADQESNKDDTTKDHESTQYYIVNTYSPFSITAITTRIPWNTGHQYFNYGFNSKNHQFLPILPFYRVISIDGPGSMDYPVNNRIIKWV